MPRPIGVPEGEFVGLQVRISKSSHPGFVGLEGRIVDETKNMLIVRTQRGIKKIPKETSVFVMTYPDGKEVEVDGIKIVGRPEDRIRQLG